jgi:hypothetical protein
MIIVSAKRFGTGHPFSAVAAHLQFRVVRDEQPVGFDQLAQLALYLRRCRRRFL